MSLTLVKSTKKKSFRDSSIMIYGDAGIGKTTFASQFKNEGKLPYCIATEDGQHQVEMYVSFVGNFADLKRTIDELEANKKELREKCSCIVLDLAKDLNEMIGEAVLDSYNSRQEKRQAERFLNLAEAGDRGSAYGVKAENTIKYFRKLFALLPVVVIAHPVTKEYTNTDGSKEKDITRPDLQQRVFDWLNGKCDSVAYMFPTGKKEGPPVALTFKPSPKRITKTRFKNICKTYGVDPFNMAATLEAIEADFNK